MSFMVYAQMVRFEVRCFKRRRSVFFRLELYFRGLEVQALPHIEMAGASSMRTQLQ